MMSIRTWATLTVVAAIAIVGLWIGLHSSSAAQSALPTGNLLVVSPLESGGSAVAFLNGNGWMGPSNSAYLNYVTPAIWNRTNQSIQIESETPVGKVEGFHLVRVRRQYVASPSGFAFSGTSEGHFHYVAGESSDLTLNIPSSGKSAALISNAAAVVTERPCPYQDVFTYREDSKANVAIRGIDVTYEFMGVRYRQFLRDAVISRDLN